jgi:hypothetical protein
LLGVIFVHSTEKCGDYKQGNFLFMVSLFTTQTGMLNLLRKGIGFKIGWITIS